MAAGRRGKEFKIDIFVHLGLHELRFITYGNTIVPVLKVSLCSQMLLT